MGSRTPLGRTLRRRAIAGALRGVESSASLGIVHDACELHNSGTGKPYQGGRWRERETCLFDRRLSVALWLWNGAGEVRGAPITGSLSFHAHPPLLHGG